MITGDNQKQFYVKLIKNGPDFSVVEITFALSPCPSIRTPVVATLAHPASQLLAMLSELPPGHLPPTFLLSHAVCHVDLLSHHITSS